MSTEVFGHLINTRLSEMLRILPNT